MIQPTGLSVLEWADAMTPTIARYGDPGRLDDPGQWQAWAANATSLPTIADDDPPNPYQFASWDEWARRFIDLPSLQD